MRRNKKSYTIRESIDRSPYVRHAGVLFKEARRKKLENRISDKITKIGGSMKFVYLHLFWFLIWITINLQYLPVAKPFDPFPFGLLTMIVSLEAIFLSTFVLISQNRQYKFADIRAQNDYEVNVKAEKEVKEIQKEIREIKAMLKNAIRK